MDAPGQPCAFSPLLFRFSFRSACRCIKFSPAPLDLLAFSENEDVVHVVDMRRLDVMQNLDVCCRAEAEAAAAAVAAGGAGAGEGSIGGLAEAAAEAAEEDAAIAVTVGGSGRWGDVPGSLAAEGRGAGGWSQPHTAPLASRYQHVLRSLRDAGVRWREAGGDGGGGGAAGDGDVGGGGEDAGVGARVGGAGAVGVGQQGGVRPGGVFRVLGAPRGEPPSRSQGEREEVAGLLRWSTLLTEEETSPVQLGPGYYRGLMAGIGGGYRGGGGNDVTGLSWSPSGARLAVGSSRAVVTFEVDGRGRRQFGSGGLR